MQSYQLDKTTWDDSDFDVMGWHDATIWSMYADSQKFEFVLDIDYIFNWVYPAQGETFFRFWIAPATMVFEHISDLKIHLESPQGTIQIENLHRDDKSPTPNGKMAQHRYHFECCEGDFSLTATEFKLYVRRMPVLVDSQCLELSKRGGICFDRALVSEKLPEN